MKPVGIARYVLHGTLEERHELHVLNHNLIIVRWFYLSILTIAVVGAAVIAHYPIARIWEYVALSAALLSVNLVLYIASRSTRAPLRYYHFLSLTQIFLDLTLGMASTMIQGGIEARTTILFAIPIINSVMLFGTRFHVDAVSVMSGLSYALALFSVEITKGNNQNFDQLYVPIFFYTVLFVLIGRLLLYYNLRSLGETRDRAYDQLLALLSHQLRHPASTISAIVDTLQFNKKLSYDKATARYIDILKKENDRQTHLINNLLEVVSQNSPREQTRVSDIGKLLRDTVMSIGLAHDRDKDIELAIETDAPLSVRGSGEKIRMVLDNILDNALRYSKKGTKVEVRVLVTSSRVIISVSDHGVGILPGHRRQIFKKFGSTTAFDGEVHGAGLGMYVSEKIIRSYGGELNVRSSLGGGTLVTIKLRRIDDD